MKRPARKVLPHEQREQAQRDEEPGVLHGALRLQVKIDRLHELNAECRLPQSRRSNAAGAEPAAAERTIEVEHLPARVETSVAHAAFDGQKAARKPGVRPV